MFSSIWVRIFILIKQPIFGKIISDLNRNLDNKIPIEYAKEIMPELSTNIALFPPVILDNLSSSSYWKGGKDVCAHYTHAEFQDMVSTPKESSGLKK